MTTLRRIWRWAWGLRLYILAAMVVAFTLAFAASIVFSVQWQNRRDAQRDRDEAAARAQIVRITADEATIQTLVDQNRRSINNNSAMLGTSRLDISDLRAIIAQTKDEVVRQLDGLPSVGLPTPTDTVAAKLIALLDRLDKLDEIVVRLDARVTALEASASQSPATTRPTPSGTPTRSPRAETGPRPAPDEHCIVQHVAFCASAKP
jgi:hypothetical protein